MKLLLAFALRWIVTSFGLWVAIRLFGVSNGLPDMPEMLDGSGSDVADIMAVSTVYLTAGLILSVINLFIKPFVSLISLPITIVTLGLFTLIVNGLMVYLALQLTPGVDITFWNAVLAGIIIGIVNYIINAALGTLKAVS